MTTSPYIKVTTSFAGSVVLTAVVAGCGEYSNPNYAGPTPFVRDLWLQGETFGMDDGDAPRLRMADGLVDDYVLIGKSKADIDHMLGPITQTSKFSNYDRVYWLGPERGFMSIDSEWLVIGFDERGICDEAEIVRD